MNRQPPVDPSDRGASAVVGVLLAAGQSRRFGADKLTSPLADGVPMALASARNMRQAVAHMVVIIRQEQHTLQRQLLSEGFHCVTCSNADQGMGYSLACAVRATPEAPAWLISLADLPHISPDVYRQVIAVFLQRGGIVRPTYQGQPGHPVIFDQIFKENLLSCRDPHGARTVIATHAARLSCVAVSHPGCIADIDRPEEIFQSLI